MQTLNLCGSWQACQKGKNEKMPASVPGCIHTDLLAAGKIEDPFYRDNEDTLHWIGETDWTYTRTFTVPEELLGHDRVLLRCEGLDTFASIAVNGKPVGDANNMFRIWEFDVRDALVPGENTIEVSFAPTIPYIKERQAERSLPGWGGPKEIRGRAWVRKEPCNFGWDWGPVLVTCGIWRTIELVAFSQARLGDVAIRQEHSNDGAVTVNVAASVDASGGTDLEVRVAISLEGELVAEATAPVTEGSAELALPIDDPQLWWPNGMGEQPLYKVKVKLRAANGDKLDKVCKRIGLRTLRLDRHADQWGETFQFVANGVPFFSKGANWIPADSFVTRLTDDNYRHLLQSTADANMNMLRVWGGGIYEQEVFYELCDELGICLWHDFMFSCSTYPTFDDEFMANVREEASDNIRRLRHHACIAMWCGNNELEQGLVGEGWTGSHMSWEDYGRLFDDMLPELVGALDPDRDYWPSSPHTPGGDRGNFNDPDRGDAHLWSVWHGREPFEWYRTCTHRFNSEFGFQSFPEPRTVYGYTAPQDRNVTTYVMEHHQRSGIGNTVIMQYMLDWFRLPTSFENNLWLSQILQGMAMKYAVEHWRRAMPRGMGTLYWQLNDCWPVASWASIDYHGRWKALHHMAKKFNAPMLVSGVEDMATGEVELHVTSEMMEPTDAALTWLLTDVAGSEVDGGTIEAEMPARVNTLVETLRLDDHLQARGNRDLILWLDLAVDGESVSSNLVLFARPKHLELGEPNLTASVEDAGDGAFHVQVSADKPALWVWLGLGDGDAMYSDSFFHVCPGHPVSLTIKPAEAMTLAEVREKLELCSLVDTYRA